MIDPRVLRTFLAVCREGSISGASRLLSISQPSVSVAISQLEARLGGSLFERGRRGVVLTPAGSALQMRAEMMEVVLRDAENAVTLAKAGVRGPLTVGGTPGALVSLVPGAVERLERDERVALTIIERADAQLTDLLRRGEVDVAVVTTSIEQAPDDIEETPVARDPFSLIVGRAHDDLGPTVTLGEVGDFGWVLPKAAGAFHRQVEAMFVAAETPLPLDAIRCDSLLTSKAIVRSGRRVTLLPQGVVAAELSMGVLRSVPLADVGLSRSIGIRTLRGRPLSELGEAFVQAIVAMRDIP